MAEGYHDFSAGEDLTAANLESYCEAQSIMRFASAAARDTALSAIKSEGMFAYLIDVNTVTVYNGSAWSTIGPVHGAWTTWTPIVTQGGSVTVTNTLSRYRRLGRDITGYFNLSVTGSGTASNAISISPPVTAATSAIEVGVGNVRDSSSTSNHPAHVFLGSTTNFDLRQASGNNDDNRLGIVTASFSAALASGDTIRGCFTYETAADA